MLPLGAYLLKPVQRVLKYSLLLEVCVCSVLVRVVCVCVCVCVLFHIYLSVYSIC